MPVFEVDDLNKFKKNVESSGGKTSFIDKNFDYAIFSDLDNSSFMVRQNNIIEFY